MVEAVIGKLFISEEGVIVTAELETLLTLPVKSSMRSSWPEARFEFAMGRLKAVVTGRVPEFERFRVRVEPLRVREFARLTSMPIPVLLVTACEVVIVDVNGPTNEAMQTVLLRHGWLRLVIVEPVPLKKASVAPEKVMATVL
jgi:hypothetical protein